MPVVDANGTPTPAWIQFFQNLQARTGGAEGPSAPFTGTTTDPATAAEIAALSATVSGYTAQIAAATAAASDAKQLALLADDASSRSDDQAVLLAQAIAD